MSSEEPWECPISTTPRLMVVVSQVVLPRREHPEVGGGCGLGVDRPATEPDTRRGQLRIHRGVDVAHLGEAGRLGHGHCGLLGIDMQIGIRRLLPADRGVDVEAVDRRVLGRRTALHGLRSVGVDHRRGQVGQTGIVGQTGSTQPHRSGGIRPTDCGRGGGGGLLGRGATGCQRARQRPRRPGPVPRTWPGGPSSRKLPAAAHGGVGLQSTKLQPGAAFGRGVALPTPLDGRAGPPGRDPGPSGTKPLASAPHPDRQAGCCNPSRSNMFPPMIFRTASWG